jgi:hypothetical protein
VYFLVYEIIYYMAKSRGGQILKGLVIVAVIWLLSEAFGLKTLSFIFEKLWALGVVIIVVIFQPEIRKALSRLGERTSMQKNIQATQKAIERIAMACSFFIPKTNRSSYHNRKKPELRRYHRWLFLHRCRSFCGASYNDILSYDTSARWGCGDKRR